MTWYFKLPWTLERYYEHQWLSITPRASWQNMVCSVQRDR